VCVCVCVWCGVPLSPLVSLSLSFLLYVSGVLYPKVRIPLFSRTASKSRLKKYTGKVMAIGSSALKFHFYVFNDILVHARYK